MKANRLLKLADHLERGKLGHKVFFFGAYNAEGTKAENQPVFKKKCGTLGCAIGECPFAFPRNWKFNDFGYPVISSTADEESSGMQFFGINSRDYAHLFIPGLQYDKKLRDTATRKQVAAHIRKFVKEYDEE